jgi:chemosensory pili system protein ChpA (sensor histidine kinase/response regulator)
VHEAYRLTDEQAGDYEDASLGRIDPAWVAQAKRRVLAAKESWSSAAEGDQHRLAGLDEQFAALAESLTRLFPSGEVLAQTLQRAVVATLRSAPRRRRRWPWKWPPACSTWRPRWKTPPSTSPSRPSACAGWRAASRPWPRQAAEPLEDWMEDLYRRVSDRQTLGSVVHELRASLSEIERQCDEYFRNPTQRELLIPCPASCRPCAACSACWAWTRPPRPPAHARRDRRPGQHRDRLQPPRRATSSSAWPTTWARWAS